MFVGAKYRWEWKTVAFQFNLLILRSQFQVHGIRLGVADRTRESYGKKTLSDLSFRGTTVKKTGTSHGNCINTNMFSIV